MNRGTICVVEDDKPLLDAIKEKLLEKGFDILTYKTAEGALLEMQHSPKIDLFWLDHYLPGDLTGAELISRIKKQNQYKNIPIIVVSNVGWSGRVLSYSDLGITKYFIKSNYSLDEIVNEVLKIINDFHK
jgi:two-component system chemotaxis response regulator CheY